MESNTSVLASISAQHLRTEHLENPPAQLGGAAAPVQEGQDTCIELGSGTYIFEYPMV